MRELVPSDIITKKLLRDGTLKTNETEVEDALESRFTLMLLVELNPVIALNIKVFTAERFLHHSSHVQSIRADR